MNHFATLLHYLDFIATAAGYSATGNLSPSENAALTAVKTKVSDLAAQHTGDAGVAVAAHVATQVLPFVEQLALSIFPAAKPEIDLAAQVLAGIDSAVVAGLSGTPVQVVVDPGTSPQP